MAKLVRSRLFQQRHQMSPGTRRTDVRQGVERGMLYRIERLLEQLSPDGIDNSNTAREIRNECSGRSMMDRLLVTTPLLYAEADRHLSEAELRLGLIPPGVALAGVLAAGTGIPVAAQLSLCVLIVGLLVNVYTAAVTSLRRSEQIVVNAVVNRLVDTPTIDRIKHTNSAGN